MRVYTRKSPVERFWNYVRVSDGCWIWSGAIADTGYGIFQAGSTDCPRLVSAHRYSYELHHRPLTLGECVMHVCDVRACVNPNHLRAGSLADNNRDMAAKGRARNKHTKRVLGSPV